MAQTDPWPVERATVPLPSLGPALRQRSAILVSVERWSDGAIIARWPEAGLYAYGDDMGDAVEALAEVVEEYWVRMRTREAPVDPDNHGCWRIVSSCLWPATGFP